MPDSATPEPDVPLFDLRLTAAEVEAVADTLRSGWLTQGPRVAAFEEAFAARLGAPHALAVSSATSGLSLALAAVGVGPGDEVIVPAYTFVATASCVAGAGAVPVFADVLGPHDLSLDPQDVVARITPRTRAVVAVHMAGFAAPVAALAALCADHGLALIEDAAHGPGITAGDRPAGTVGAVGVFSLFTNKVLGVGEGGVVVTADDAVAASVRTARSHGLTTSSWERHRGAPEYDVERPGVNARLDEPRAALALARLGGLDADLAARRAHVAAYRAELGDAVPAVAVPYAGVDPALASGYVLPVLLPAGTDRPAVRAAMRARGIATGHHYPPVHLLSAFRGDAAAGLARTEDAAARELTLPLYPHLDAAGRGRVVAALAAALDA